MPLSFVCRLVDNFQYTWQLFELSEETWGPRLAFPDENLEHMYSASEALPCVRI